MRACPRNTHQYGSRTLDRLARPGGRSLWCGPKIALNINASTAWLCNGQGRQGSSHVRAQPPTSQDAPTSNLMAAAAAHGQHSEDTSSGAASDSDADGAVIIDIDNGEVGEDEYEEVVEDGEGSDGMEADGMEEEEEDPLLAGLEVEEAGPGVDTGQVAWGEACLTAVKKVLALPAMAHLQLYLFRALVVERKLDIRLDRLDDLYGSPSIDDIEKFSRMLGAALEAALGPELAGDITREVSSPGAERSLVLPQDLSRFATLPLRVEWRGAEGGTQSQVLQLMEFDEAAGRTRWQVADVRANAPTKGRGLSKRQRAMVLEIPVSNIQRAKVHVDF